MIKKCFLLIIIMLFLYKKTHYNLKFDTDTIEPSTDTIEPSTDTIEPSTDTIEPSTDTIELRTIPKIIHCTYFTIETIPSYVWENLKKYSNDYKIIFYDDKDCISFLKKNFNQQYSNKFKKLKIGAHKADFFRYCVIYILGGIYLDIKIVPMINFENIFNHDEENLLYTCLGSYYKKENMFEFFKRKIQNKGNGHIFQAVIASYPKNQIFKELINDFFIIQNPHNNYHIFTYKFYDTLYYKLKYHLYPGEHHYKEQKIILFNEVNQKQNINEIKDRYNGYYYIENNDKTIFKSRYNDFPWK